MTANYDSQGLQFRYPENWKLVEDTSDEIPRTIQLQSPSGAFWSVDIHPFSVSTSELLENVLKVMKDEYPDLESHPLDEEIAGELAIGCDLFFQCLDFIVAAKLRALRRGHATYLLTYQAEDREFDELEPVFRAITIGLFQEE